MFGFDDPDEDGDECPYVGRREQLEEVRRRMTSRSRQAARLIQVLGPSGVGKKCFVQQVLRLLREEASNKAGPGGLHWKIRSYHVNCPKMTSLDDVTACFSDSEESYPDSGFHSVSSTATSDVICHFRSVLDRVKHEVHVWVFWDWDQTPKEWKDHGGEMLQLVQQFTALSRTNAFVMVTSRRLLEFPKVPAHDVTLPRLQAPEVRDLLRHEVPDVDLKAWHVQLICDWCRGLPGEILKQAARLKRTSCGHLTPDELCEDLRDSEKPECADLEPLLKDEEPAVLEFLGKIFLFKGSFGVSDVAAVTNEGRTVKVKENLLKLARSGLVESEPGSERMRILPEILEGGAALLSHVTHDDTVRLRFVTYFGRVLVRAERDFYVKPLDVVYGFLHADWPNLKQVLLEAIHCSQNTFSAFFQVARVADSFLVKCFPEEAVCFYRSLMDASAMFGTREEQAVCQGLLGMALTRGHAPVSGADNEAALELMRSARQVLQDSGSAHLLDLDDNMGFNLYRQGKYTKAYRTHFQAIQRAGDTEADQKLLNRLISLRSNMAISMIFLGRFKEAEQLLQETMQLAEQVAPHHPALPIMLNSLGLIYERSRWSDERALQYYHASLKQRRQYRGAARLDLVVVLNNVAMQHSKRGFHVLGLELLGEALEIRREHGWQEYQTALTLWNMGQVYRRTRNFLKAIELMEEASKIFSKCSKEHFVNCEVHLDLAHCQCLLGDHERALEHLKAVAAMSELCRQHLPQGNILLEALEHLVLVFRRGGDYFRLLTEELRRLIKETSDVAAVPALHARLLRWQEWWQRGDVIPSQASRDFVSDVRRRPDDVDSPVGDVSRLAENVMSSASDQPAAPTRDDVTVSSSQGDGPAGGDDVYARAEDVTEMAEFVASNCHVCQDCEQWKLAPRTAWLRTQGHQVKLDRLRDQGADTSNLPEEIQEVIPPPFRHGADDVTLKQPLADPSVSLSAVLKSLLNTECLAETSVPDGATARAQPLSSSSLGGCRGSSGFCDLTGTDPSRTPPCSGGPGQNVVEDRGALQGTPSPLVIPDSPLIFPRLGLPLHLLSERLTAPEPPAYVSSVQARGPRVASPEAAPLYRPREPVEDEEPLSLKMPSLHLDEPPKPRVRGAMQHDERMHGRDVTCSVEGCCCSIRNSPCPRHDDIT